MRGRRDLCARLIVLTKKKGARATTRALSLSDTAESSICCGFDTVALGGEDGKQLVRVTSKWPSRDCYGGTATVSLDHLYELQGDKLVLVESGNVELH